MYGKLIWDTEKDGERAKSYFDQAVSASPDDWYVRYVSCSSIDQFMLVYTNCDLENGSMVMGSYAQFMWEAEDDEDENNEEESEFKVSVPASQPMVSAF